MTTAELDSLIKRAYAESREMLMLCVTLSMEGEVTPDRLRAACLAALDRLKETELSVFGNRDLRKHYVTREDGKLLTAHALRECLRVLGAPAEGDAEDTRGTK